MSCESEHYNHKKEKGDIKDVTDTISDHVQSMLIFNHDLPELYNIYQTDKSRHEKYNLNHDKIEYRYMFTDEMTPKIKAKTISLLSEDEILDLFTTDNNLAVEVLPYLSKDIFLYVMMSFTETFILPILLRSKRFLTYEHIKDLKRDSFFYCLEYKHIIANNIDPFTLETIDKIDTRILPIDHKQVDDIISSLAQYVVSNILDRLKLRMISFIENKKYNPDSLDYANRVYSYDNQSNSVNQIIGARWLKKVGNVITYPVNGLTFIKDKINYVVPTK